MAGNARDVQLIVRAKTEGQRALDSMSDALKQLFAAANGGSGDLAEVGRAVLAVDKAMGTLAPSVEKGAAAFDRQLGKLGETVAELASVNAQIKNATAAIDKMRAASDADAAAKLAYAQKIKGAEASLAALETRQRKLNSSLQAQQGAIAPARNSLQQLASMANAADVAISGIGGETAANAARAAAAHEEETRALREKMAVEQQERAALLERGRLLNAIEQNTGTTRPLGIPSAGGTALADMLREEASAAKIAADEERAVAAERAQVEAIQQKARLLNAIEQNTGTGRPQSSASSTAFADQLRAEEVAAQEAAASEALLTEKAQELRAAIDPLGAIQAKLNAELAEADELYQAGKISAQELAQAQKVLARDAQDATDHLNRIGRGEKGKLGLFGLKPYELTNLGYQLNDVFTQIASGTSITQTLAQQGGQILQLFPKAGAAISAALSNPAVLAGAATIGLIALAVKRLVEEANRLKGFAADLTLIGDKAGNSAASLNDVARELTHLGVEASKASSTVQTLVFHHLDPQRLKLFAEAAREMSNVLGTETPQAAEQLATGLTGSYDQLVQLDNLLHNVLTPDEREHIRLMYEHGDADKARAEATTIITRRLKEANDQLRENDKTSRTLSQAWDDLMESFSHSGVIRTIYDDLVKLLDKLNDAIKWIQDHGSEIGQATQNAAAQALPGYGVYRAYRDAVDASKPKPAAPAAPGTPAAGAPAAPTAPAIPPEEQNRLNAIRAQAQVDSEIVQLETRLAEARREGRAQLQAQIQGQIAEKRALQQSHDAATANAAKTLAVQQALAAVEEQRIQTGQALLSTAGKFLGRKENNASDADALQQFFKVGGIKLDPEKQAWCAAFVNAVLQGNGIKGTADARAASFKDFGSGVDLARAEPGDIVLIKGGKNGISHVGFFQGTTANGNVRVLGGNQGPEGQGAVTSSVFKRSSIAGIRRAPLSNSADTQAAQLEQQRLDTQAQFDGQLIQENTERERSIEQLKQIQGLDTEQLFAKQRQQAIDNALFAAQQRADQQHVEFSEQQRKAIEASAGAEYDLLHARERIAKLVDDPSSERDAILQRLEQARALGDTNGVAALEDQLKQIDGVLQSAIDKAIKFWSQFDTAESRAAITNLTRLKAEVPDTEKSQRQVDLQSSLDHSTALRDEMLQRVDFLRSIGQTDVAEQLRGQITGLDEQILKTTDDLIAWWQTSNRPEAAETIAHLQNMRAEIVQTQQEIRISAGDIQDAFSNDFVNGVTTFAQTLAETGNVFQSLRDAALQFTADFLKDLAMMILKAVALKLALKLGFGGIANGLTSMLNAAPVMSAAATLSAAGGVVSAGGAAVGAGAAALGTSAAALMAAAQMLIVANSIGNAGVFHGGGIAGSASLSRNISPSVFAGAARYHVGGFAGLRPGEVPAILERGEEILTKTDARHRMNGGGMRGGAVMRSIKAVLALGDDQVAAAMQGSAGEDVTLLHIRRNAATVKQYLEGGA